MVSVSRSFWFPVSPILPSPPFLSPVSSSFEAWMKFVCLLSSLLEFMSPSDCSLLFFFFFFLYHVGSICLCLFHFSPSLHRTFIFVPSSAGMRRSLVCFLVIFLLVFLLLVLPSLVSFLSLALSVFQSRRWKDQSCLAVCCLRSESFSSGSLPHAASLTARVKRTDPPRIANVLRGNQLNYAHCGGEDIHNKLLKVTRYLALQLPAVYRRWGMFFAKLTRTFLSLVSAMRLTEGKHHGSWSTLTSSAHKKDARRLYVERHQANRTALPQIPKRGWF